MTGIARTYILNATKAQYEPGPMRPRLCEIFRVEATYLKTPKFAWLYYAGMGNMGMNTVAPQYADAIKELKKEGYLVPTQEYDHYGAQQCRYLTHFDDVNWGRDGAGDIVIYNIDAGFPDQLIRLDAKHADALNQLKHRFTYNKTMDDDAITLEGGTVITPILTDARIINLRLRQKKQLALTLSSS